MATEKVKKRDPVAEQQVVGGSLYPNMPFQTNIPYGPTDWIITESDGSRTVLTNAQFTQQYDKV